jgi:uncharacterized repeat protein (TIGR01451 family)
VLLALTALALTISGSTALAATFTVINTSDDGPGSLRQAITDANANPGADIITFNLPGPSLVISPTSALPDITAPVAIDGTSQPGYTNAPLVTVDGTAFGSADGFRLVAGSSNSSIKGLTITGFSGVGIRIDASSQNIIQSNVIGRATPVGSGNGAGGITISAGVGLTTASGNVIGGWSNPSSGKPADNTVANIIAGNGGPQILITQDAGVAASNTVQGDLIGTNRTGDAIGGGGEGILFAASENNAWQNDIRGVTGDGIAVASTANRISLIQNLFFNIGTNLPIALRTNGAATGNHGQTAPLITGTTHTTVTGTLDGLRQNSTYVIDFGQGLGCKQVDTALGAVNTTTDGNGHADFSFTSSNLTTGKSVTATARNTGPDATYNGDTSELGNCGLVPAAGSQADLQVGLTGPDTVVAGTNVTYSLVVKNNGPDTSGYSVSVVLDSHLTLVSAPGCTGTTTLTCTGSLANGGQDMISIQTSTSPSLTPGTVLSTTATGSTTGGVVDPTPGNDSSTKNTTSSAEADLKPSATGPTGTVAANTAPVAGGPSQGFTLKVTNNGPSDHTGSYTVTDALPSGFTYVTGSNADCTGTTTITCTRTGTLAPTAFDTFAVQVAIGSSVPEGSHNSTISASSGGTTDPVTNDGYTLATETLALADLAVSAIDQTGGNHVAGDAAGFDYKLTVTNLGPSDNSAYHTALTLPAGFSFGSTLPGGCVVSAGVVTCTQASGLGAGLSKDFIIHVKIASSVVDGTKTAQIAVGSDGTTDPTPGNDTGTVDAAVITQADLGLEDSVADTHATGWGVTGSSLVAGDDITYTLTVTNHGPSDRAGVFKVVDVLPHGATFADPPGGECDRTAVASGSNGDTVTCTGPASLVSGAQKTFTFTADVNPAELPNTSYADNATIDFGTGTAQTPTNPWPDSASASAALVARADLGVTEQVARPASQWGTIPSNAVVAGDARGYTYTLTAKNYGPSANAGFTVTDVLPHGATYVSSGTGDPCHVSAPVGGGHGETVTCTGSGLALNATQPFTVQVFVPASESFNPYADDTAYSDAATVATTSTPQPTASPSGLNADTAHVTSTLVARAELEALTLVHQTPFGNPDTVYANPNGSQNQVIYIYKFANNGPSDSRGIVLSLPLPHSPPGASLIGHDWGYCQDPNCTVSSFSPYPTSGDQFPIDRAPAGSTTTVVVRVQADPNSRAGAFKNLTVTGTVAASTPQTSDPNTTKTDSATDTTPTPITGIEIDTVPNPPTATLATASNNQAGLQWLRPSNEGGKPITKYTVYASPCPSSTGPPVAGRCVVLDNISATENATVNGKAAYSYLISLPNGNGFTFSLTVTATNVVGESDSSNELSVAPTQAADTEKITNNTATVDTGLNGGAVPCANPSDPNCKNIVSNYTINDPNNNGALVNVDAEKRATPTSGPLGAMALIAAAAAEPPVQCVEVDLNTGAQLRGNPTTGEHCGKGDKVVRSTYPLAKGDKIHLETDQYDRTIMTDAAGVACLKLETASDGTLPRSTRGTKPVILECESPDYPKLFLDANGNKTNICPDGKGWMPAKPCAYIYYESMLMPGFDISCAGSGTTSCKPTPCPNGPPPANCNITVAIGSSVAAGIRIHPVVGGVVQRSVLQIVRPWCTGIFPFFVSTPCVRSYQTLVIPAASYLDTRVQTYVNNDPIKGAHSG